MWATSRNLKAEVKTTIFYCITFYWKNACLLQCLLLNMEKKKRVFNYLSPIEQKKVFFVRTAKTDICRKNCSRMLECKAAMITPKLFILNIICCNSVYSVLEHLYLYSYDV